MSNVINRWLEWRKIQDTQTHKEDPTKAAGQEGEEFVLALVESSLNYKGVYCFMNKRVRSKKDNKRYEVDLVVLTKKHIYFLEVKNWSGELFQKGNNWIQKRLSGETLMHPNLTHYNLKKQDAMIEYLRSKGINLDKSYFSQKVIFIKHKLKIAPKIVSNPNVIPAHKLDGYLSKQKTIGKVEKFIHSVIEFCLDSEKSGIVLDGIYHSMNKKQFEAAQKALSSLETWDKIVFNGGEVVTGDLLKLSIANGKAVKIKSIPNGTQVELSWNRSKFGGLMQALFSKKALGQIKLKKQWQPISTKDTVKFHSAGEKSPQKISLRDINMIVRG